MDADPENNGLLLCERFVPEELLCDLMCFYLDANALAQCQQVCKRWNQLLKAYVWRHKAALSTGQRYPPDDPSLEWFDYCCIYAISTRNAFNCNLVKNHSGANGLRKGKEEIYWSDIRKGGHGWKVENPPIGVPLLPDDAQFPDNEQHCFATSFGECSKVYVVDLLKEGIPPAILDHFQPPIQVSEMYAARHDCGGSYLITVELRKENGDVIVSHTFSDVLRDERLSEWYKYQFTFQKYGKEARFVYLRHLAVDSRFWAGHYGPKISRTCIRFLPPNEAIAPNSVTIEEYRERHRTYGYAIDDDDDELAGESDRSDSISSAYTSDEDDDDVSLD